MAWSTTRIDYDRADSSLQVLIGSGGAPNVATKSARAMAVRTDASNLAAMLYMTVDSGSTWQPVQVGGVAAAFLDVNVTADMAAAGTGVALTTEQLQFRTSTFTLTNSPISLTDEVGVVAYGGLKFADLPAGAILFAGVSTDLAITKSSAGVNDDWDGDYSVGTVTAANDATLTGTEANLLASTATPQAVAGATTANGHSATAQACTVVDGTSTAVDLYLNFVVDDADHDVTSTPCNLIANGTITVTWANLGDY
jgi:hypothetical protein